LQEKYAFTVSNLSVSFKSYLMLLGISPLEAADVTTDDIAMIISSMTGINVASLLDFKTIFATASRRGQRSLYRHNLDVSWLLL